MADFVFTILSQMQKLKVGWSIQKINENGFLFLFGWLVWMFWVPGREIQESKAGLEVLLFLLTVFPEQKWVYRSFKFLAMDSWEV